MKKKFKKGDYVKIIKDTCCHKIAIGTIMRIYAVHKINYRVRGIVSDNIRYVTAEDIKAVKTSDILNPPNTKQKTITKEDILKIVMKCYNYYDDGRPYEYDDPYMAQGLVNAFKKEINKHLSNEKTKV